MNAPMGLFAALLALIVCGCGAADQAADRQPIMPLSNTVVAPLIDDMNKARAVKDTLQDAQHKTKALINAAESSGE